MQSSRKIGILLLLLAIPIFLLIILQFFSTSHYNIPVYYENGIDSLSQCEASTEVHRVGVLTAANLITQKQQQVDFRDRIRIIYWLSGDCEDTCQLVLEELARLQGIFEDEAILQLLVLSNTPSDHAVQLSKTYLQEQPEWLFLQGTEVQSGSFVQCELVLPHPNIPLEETLVLIDEEGRIRGYYRGTDSKEVDRLIGEIRILLYNMNQAHANYPG